MLIKGCPYLMLQKKFMRCGGSTTSAHFFAPNPHQNPDNPDCKTMYKIFAP